MNSNGGIYQFKIPGLTGGVVDFSVFEGKKVLVVNTASECGFTYQYSQLQELADEFAEQLVVVGVPSNDFGAQEPGADKVIAEFCQVRFGVTFPLTTKLPVKGMSMHPLYKWLTEKEQNGKIDAEVKWNFHKFLIDENGRLIGEFPSNIEPSSEDILQHLN